jgi:hypothetical protein
LTRVSDALRRRDPAAADVEAQLAAQADEPWTPDEWRGSVEAALRDREFRLIIA